MAKQLNVDLTINANTAKAKEQMLDLQKSLQNLQTSAKTSPDLFNTKSIREAAEAAQQLQKHLQAATDANTGKLNLSTFSASLKASNTTLQDYKRKLEALGPSGEEAFLKISKSIAMADAPLRKTNAKLHEFATTLKNTVRWQISSSILHGFMGAVQQAYGYAQNLNESLTNIRIVTGQSSEQMAEFAKRANKAAQALSTTTTAYTDAALIFYQQGLDDKSVEERTNATIKMSQATGDAATDVSSYMTAIWNNFDNGSESLEHYADVITALGASTASSSSEIAEGLSKFASVADTVGLSYEYATSALATVVAETRQSADVVGTAFKTLFARIQDLELGNTLDDGTTLGKYSQALATIGVNIKDSNGQMKDMNTILDEMGAKWSTLSSDTQVAVAQAVAGTRQYTQLVALMENYDKFKQNLTTAEGADGTLDAQAEIYAESWEAAQKRVRAALENIYKTALDDKFFIKLNDGFATLLQGVKGFMDGFGGMKGILLTIGAFITQSLAKEAPAALDRIKEDLLVITHKAKTMAEQMQEKNLQNLHQESVDSMQKVDEGEGSMAYAAQIQMTEILAEKKMQLNQYTDQYSQAEKDAAEIEIANIQMASDAMAVKGRAYDEQIKHVQELRDALISKKPDTDMLGLEELGKQRGNLQALQTTFKKFDESANDAAVSVKDLGARVKAAAVSAKAMASTDIDKNTWGNFAKDIDAVTSAFEKGEITEEEARSKLKALGVTMSGEVTTSLNQVQTEIDGVVGTGEDADKELQNFAETCSKAGRAGTEVKLGLENAKQGFADLKPHVATTGEALIAFSGSLMQCQAFISSMTRLNEVFSDKDATTVQKLGAVIGALSAVMMLYNSMAKLTVTLNQLENKSILKKIALHGQETVVKLAKIVTDKLMTAGILSQAAANAVLKSSMLHVLATTLLVVAAMAALVLVITAVTAIVRGLSEAYNKDALAAEEAEAAAKNLAAAADEAKQALDELLSDTDEYKSLVEELNKCTKGTEEWNEAMEKVNDSASALLKKYPELLKQKDLYNNDGTLNQEAIDSVIAQYEDRVNNADAAALMANANAAQLRVKANQTDTVRSDNMSVWAGIGAGAATGALAGAAFEGIGAIPGAIIGAVAGGLSAGIGNAVDDSIQNSQIDKLAEQYALIGEEALTNDKIAETLGIDMANATQAQLDYIESVKTVVRETEAAATAMDNAARAIVGDWAEERNVELDETQTAMMGEAYQDLYESIKAEVIKTDNDNNMQADKTDHSGVWDRYNAAMGTNLKLSGNGIQGDDNHRVYEYLEDGETKKVTLEEIAETIAAAEALEQLGNCTADVNAALQHLADNAGEATDGIKKWISTGNMSEMTHEDFESMQSSINDDYGGDVDAYLQDMFGMTAEQLAAMFGDNYVESFTNSMNQYEESWANAGENLTATPKAMFDEMFGDGGVFADANITAAAKQNFANMLQTIFNSGGEEALQYAQQFIGTLGNLSDEELGQVTDMMNNIDWTDWDAEDAFRAQLEEAGLLAKIGEENLSGFCAQMRDANNAVKHMDLKGLTDEIGELNKVANDLQQGDTVSADDFQTIYAQLGEDANKYFSMMADGTYQLTGDAEEFLALVSGKGKAEMRENLKAAQAEIQNLQDKKAEGQSALGNHQLSDINHDVSYQDENDAWWYNGDKVQAQIDLIQSMGAANADMIAEWQADLDDNNTMSLEHLQQLGEAAANAGISYEGLDEEIHQAQVNMQYLEEAYASQITSLNELEGALADGTISAATFNKSLDQVTRNEAEAFDLDFDDVVDQATQLADAFNLDAVAARKMAIQNQRMNRGVENGVNNMKDWKKALTSADKTSMDYVNALQDVSACVSDLVGAQEDLKLSSEFVEDNMELIEEAAKGSEEAINKLGVEVAKFQVQAMENPIDPSTINSAWSAQQYQQFETWRNTVLNGLNELQNSLDGLNVGDDVYGKLGGDDWVNALNQMALSTQMSVDDMNAMLNSMGVEAEVTTKDVPQKIKVPVYTTTEEVSSSGGENGEPTTYTKVSKTVQTGTEEMDGVISVAQINTGDAIGSQPKITYTGNGNVSNTAKNGGKSGGSGGGNKKKTEDKKTFKDEAERYHVVNNQLEDIEKQLDKISKAKDRAFGAAKLKLMDQEIAKQDKLIKKQKQYLDEVKQYYKSDGDIMRAYGAKMDENGTITNYNSLLQAQIDKYNAAVEAFNNSAQEEADQDALDKAKEAYEKFKDALDKYEDTQDKLLEAQQAVIDAENEKLDMMLEKVEYKLEIRVEVDDYELNRLEFQLDRIHDKAFSAAEAIAKIGEQTVYSLDKADGYMQEMKDIFANHGLDGNAIVTSMQNGTFDPSSLDGINFTEAEKDALKEAVQAYQDELKGLLEKRQAMYDEMTDGINEYIEAFDKQIGIIEHGQSIMQSYANIIDIVGKKTLGITDDLMARLDQSSVDQAINKLTANKNKLDGLQDAADQTRAALAKATSEEEKRHWQEVLDNIEEQIQQAEEDTNAAWEEALTSISEQFQKNITRALDNFTDKLAGALGSLTELQDKYDKESEKSSRYLEDFRQIYELSKLTRKINESIDDTDNIHAKQELSELMDEINQKQEDGVKLSEYDLQYLQKKYDLKLAEMALEESQNAKSNVSMVQDNDGNFSYVYTADDSAVEQAQQNYEDKLYEMQRLNADYINDLQAQIIQAEQECADALAELDVTQYASHEEYMAACEEITSYYQGKIDYYSEQMSNVMDNNKELYNDDWQKYSEMTGYKISADEEYVDDFNETALSTLTGFETMEGYQKLFNEAIYGSDPENPSDDSLLGKLSQSYKTWKDNTDTAMKEAGTSTENFAKDAEKKLLTDTDSVANTSKKAAEETDQMKEDMKGDIDEIIGAIQSWETEYGRIVDAMLAKNTALASSFGELLAKWNAYKTQIESDTSGDDSGGGGGNGDGSGGGGDSGDGGGGKPAWSRVEAAYDYINRGKWGTGINNRIAAGARDGFSEAEVRAGQQLINYCYPPSLKGQGYSRAKAKQLMGYDTGGYTGDWGSTDGKLALLHQKELVLNADDTENMLNMVEMVREIAKIIDLNAMSASSGFGSLHSTSSVNTNGIVQEITINAEFPDATDRTEIQAAFDNIINMATQYANRK